MHKNEHLDRFCSPYIHSFCTLFLSPSSLSPADRDRERGGCGSGEAAVWLAAEQNNREKIN
jgi:hypothetical protein